MRTTLTLDDAIAIRLKQVAHAQQSSFKDVVNEALARGLSELTAREEPKPYRTKARHLGPLKGVDPTKLGQVDAEGVCPVRHLGKGFFYRLQNEALHGFGI